MLSFSFRALVVPVLLACAVARLGAKNSEWTDVQGTSFRGEPEEILGSRALFRTGPTTGRRMLLRGMSPEECRRFYLEIASRPPRADRWSDAKTGVTRDIVGRALRVEGDKLVPVDFTAIPEPELLIVLYGSHNSDEGWKLANNLVSTYQRTQRLYPGRIATFFMGVRHSSAEHRKMATESRMPWLVADFSEELKIELLARCAPADGTLLMLLSRTGVPLLSTTGSDLGAVKEFADGLAEILWHMNPSDPHGWKDRVTYLSATRPLEFAHSRGEPELVGNPLRAEGLRERGVERIAAKLDVAADGRVTQVELLPTSVVPDPMRAPLIDALRQHALILPAIENGAAVPGTLAYDLVVPPADRLAAAEAAWFGGAARVELPLGPWLVLKPIRVEQKTFENATTDLNGTLIATPFRVTTEAVDRKTQVNAFNSDWFAAAGAGSVHPTEGAHQTVDELDLTWKKIVPRDGLVDFREGTANLDYSIGYAWTEFEAPAAMDAWLGLGSDDGVKVWLNGELVDDKWIGRSSKLDDDIVPLRLRKGPNQILIKIQNVKGDWSFISRIRVREH